MNNPLQNTLNRRVSVEMAEICDKLSDLSNAIQALKPTTPRPPDFDIEFYKAQRAHEIALNNATSMYEQSVLQRVIFLNSASIAGLLVIVSAAKPETGFSYQPNFIRLAVLIWTIGIAFGFFAVWYGYCSQKNYTRAYRFRRQAIECEKSEKPVLLNRFGISNICRSNVIEELRIKANTSRKDAEREHKCAEWHGLFAVLSAIIGFIVAFFAIQNYVNYRYFLC